MKYLCFYVAMFIYSIPAVANIVILNFNKNTSTVAELKSYAQQNNLQVIEYPNERIGRISKDSFKEILDEINALDLTIDTFVFSGHATAYSFSGKDGELKQEDIKEAFESFPQMAESVNALILRGCYTGRVGAVLENSGWRRFFINLKYVAGYSGRAWSSEVRYSREFIFDSLALKKQFEKISSLDEGVKVFKKIRSYHMSALSIWVKSASDSEYYLTTDGMKSNSNLLDFDLLTDRCASMTGKRLKKNRLLQRYYKGDEEGFLRPPKNTSSSRLRKAYAFSVKQDYCLSLKLWNEQSFDSPEKAASLLFYNKLVHNFFNHYSLAELTRLVGFINNELSEEMVIPDFTKGSRGDLRDFVIELNGHLNNKAYNELSAVQENDELYLLEFYSKGLYELLLKLNTSKIPPSWLTEENSSSTPLFLRPKNSYLRISRNRVFIFPPKI